MEEVSKKYCNLQKLCMRIDGANVWTLQTTTLEVFMFTIKKKILENANHTVQTLYQDIIDISKINEAIVKEEDKKLIKRYIEYFMQICNAII